MDEQALVRKAGEGEEAAWAELVRAHQTVAFRLAYLIVADAADAEDVVQEALVQAHAALDRFDPERPFRPWLMSIVANRARNHRRSLGRYLAALRRWWQAEEVSPPTLDEVADRARAAELLWQAVRRLRPIDQEVIYLRYFLELSESESAETLGVARGTVKSRLHRALARLREVVERDFPALREGRQDEPATV